MLAELRQLNTTEIESITNLYKNSIAEEEGCSNPTAYYDLDEHLTVVVTNTKREETNSRVYQGTFEWNGSNTYIYLIDSG